MKKELILIYHFQYSSSPRRGGQGEAAWDTTFTIRKQRERSRLGFTLLLLPLFLFSLGPHSMNWHCSHSGMGFPASHKAPRKHPHRHAERCVCVFHRTQNPVMLTVKISCHTRVTESRPVELAHTCNPSTLIQEDYWQLRNRLHSTVSSRPAWAT